MSMLIDIIIVHYQNIEDTKRCIESLSKLEHDNYNIIIVDSASPNKTGLELKNFFNVILLEQNNGFAYACNKGIEASNADYIWLLNPDTTVEAQALNSLVKASEQNPSVLAFGSKVLYGEDSSKIWSAGGTVDIENLEVDMIGNMQDSNSLYLKNHLCDYLPGCSIFARTELFKKHKLPESYFMYFEETDWCYSLKEKLMYVADSIVYHHTRDDKMQSVFHVYYYNRNQSFFWFKHSNYLNKIKIYLEAVFIKLPRNLYAYLRAEHKDVYKAHVYSSLDFISFNKSKRY